MECVEYCGPWWGWGDAHSGTRDLLPVCVTKLDDIVSEDYFNGVYKCGRLVVEEWLAMYGVYVGGDVFNGGFGGDVCVHGLGIAGEKISAMWDIE